MVPRLKAILIVCLVSLLGATSSLADSGDSRILDLRVGSHPDHTRLVFDAEGARPLAVQSASDGSVLVRFGSVDSKEKLDRSFPASSGIIEKMSLAKSDASSEIRITFRVPNVELKQMIIPGDNGPGGKYRLVLDFYPRSEKPGKTGETSPEPGGRVSMAEPGTGEDGKSAAVAGKGTPLPGTEKGGSSDEAGSKAGKKARERAEKEKAEREKTEKAAAEKEKAVSDKVRGEKKAVAAATTGDQEDEVTVALRGSSTDPQRAAALYNAANEFFAAHQQDLVHAGQQVIENYLLALKADPRNAQAPVALHRIGLAYVAFENHARAAKFFNQVVHQWPAHPVAADCWVQLGLGYEKKDSFIEAIEAYRTALRCPIENSKKAEVHFYLGRDLSLFGVHKEALENLEHAVNDTPMLYLQHPDIFKHMGESLFAVGMYDKSLDYFVRYLNIEGDARDRDLVLAKIAEIMLAQGEQALASRLYNYIQARYQDSEGDVISRIRRAELLEKKDSEGGQIAALNIYETLHNKKLSPALRRIVNYRLASWQWRHEKFEKSLGLIEEMFQSKMDTTARDEFTALREKVVAAWVRKAYAQNEYALVVGLYEKYPSVAQGDSPSEMKALVAESYGALKLYPTALELYEQLLASAPTVKVAVAESPEKQGKRGKKGAKGKPAPSEKEVKVVKNEDWLLKAGLYAYEMGKGDKALQYIKDVHSDRLETEKTAIMARVLEDQGKHAEAIKYFQKLVQREPNLISTNPEAMLAYIKCLVVLGRRDEAVGVIQVALNSLAEDRKEARLQLCVLAGQCHTELRQPDKAIEFIERALSLDPSEEQRNQLNYELSKLYLATGQTEKASERLTRLLGASQSFWKTAAEQQLESIRMSGK